MFVEAHHSIEKIKRYYEPLKRVYTIIISEIFDIEPDLILQMSFKAINDSVKPHGLVSTLLVFGAYFRMIELDVFSLTIIQRSMVMKKTMKKVRRFQATRQINNALNIRNGLSTTALHDFILNLFVLI